ncbi:MAG TPA: methyltransferase domain-containing protein [Gammaproteobacteria bacterium]|nr:methyltransferase domain-containing protein [Gammaproteobacteria bacterium]
MPGNISSLLTTGKLACPRCKTPFATGENPHCSSCNIDFPVLAGIPLLVNNPEEYVGSWIQQFRNFILQQQHSIQHESNMIASPATYPPVKERLSNVIRAKTGNLQTIADLMAPLRDAGPGVSPKENITATGQFSAPHYLLRDWAWDTNEPDLMCDKVKEILPSDLSMESLLVIGAGGCRESYILHEHYNCPLTVSTDIDPFKLLAASHIISGGELNLYQIFQNNIRNAHDNVSYWKLRAPHSLNNGFHYMLSDARQLPVADNAFHVAFTPFIIDEVGEDLRAFAPRIHQLVQPGGYWVNYGVMTFRPEISYTGEEVLAIVEDSGFRILTHGYDKKFHVAPRENCLHQMFDCLYFTAVKD